jgi:hypothetical protein
MVMTVRAARRARMKLLRSLLTTWGYGLMGAAGLPFVRTTPGQFTSLQLAIFALGAMFQAVAIAIAPEGE